MENLYNLAYYINNNYLKLYFVNKNTKDIIKIDSNYAGIPYDSYFSNVVNALNLSILLEDKIEYIKTKIIECKYSNYIDFTINNINNLSSKSTFIFLHILSHVLLDGEETEVSNELKELEAETLAFIIFNKYAYRYVLATLLSSYNLRLINLPFSSCERILKCYSKYCSVLEQCKIKPKIKESEEDFYYLNLDDSNNLHFYNKSTKNTIKIDLNTNINLKSNIIEILKDKVLKSLNIKYIEFDKLYSLKDDNEKDKVHGISGYDKDNEPVVSVKLESKYKEFILLHEISHILLEHHGGNKDNIPISLRELEANTVALLVLCNLIKKEDILNMLKYFNIHIDSLSKKSCEKILKIYEKIIDIIKLTID